MTRSLVFLALLVGCSGDATSDSVTPTTGPTTSSGGGRGGGGGGGGGGTTTTNTTGETSSTTSEVAVCARWNADRADRSEGSWSGSVGTCDPGQLDATGTANTLRQVNLYRWLAGLDPVTDDPGLNASAQACSLMMDANNDIDHYPPDTWDCFTATGDAAAGSSNLATTPAVAAIDLYMVDYGNDDTLGHRRWILSNSLGPIGIGGTPDYSCLQVIGGAGQGGSQDWTAFPSPGAFPIDAMDLGGWASVDEWGWSIQSDSINLNNATITVERNGQDKPVAVTALPANYGSGYALGIKPNGWSTELGPYTVRVADIPQPFEYVVDFVDCGP